MKWPCKSTIRMAFAGFLLGAMAFAGIGIWAGLSIASPSRRSLMDYHREILASPDKHGIHIQGFSSTDGTPCLIITPHHAGSFGPRGARIRDQLMARGLDLPPPGTVIGTVVLVHGRKGRKEDYLPVAERFCAAGFRCLLPDMPAHGEHPSSQATYGIREGAMLHRLLLEAAETYQFDPSPAGLVGMSMGGSVAIHAAIQPESAWRALVVISSFDALQNVVRHQVDHHTGKLLGAPFGQFAAWSYQSRTGIPLAEIQPRNHASTLWIPTLIAHGQDDRTIPIAAGRNLYAALPEATQKQWIEVPNADHDNVLITDFPIYAEIAEWLVRHMRQE